MSNVKINRSSISLLGKVRRGLEICWNDSVDILGIYFHRSAIGRRNNGLLRKRFSVLDTVATCWKIAVYRSTVTLYCAVFWYFSKRDICASRRIPLEAKLKLQFGMVKKRKPLAVTLKSDYWTTEQNSEDNWRLDRRAFSVSVLVDWSLLLRTLVFFRKEKIPVCSVMPKNWNKTGKASLKARLKLKAVDI